jgi:hypothetical protein
MLRAHALPGDWRIDSSKRVQGQVPAGVWGCPPSLCHCEERSDEAIPGRRGCAEPREIAAPSPHPAWRMARNDRLAEIGRQSVDHAMMVQQKAAGSLRVSLSSSCSSPPKNGGQGVDCSVEDNANRSRDHARRWALPTLHVDSRFRGNDKTRASFSPRQVLGSCSVTGPESRIPHSRGKQPC